MPGANGSHGRKRQPQRPWPRSRKVGQWPGDRLPPQNLEAERSVLGSILLDNEVLHDVVTFLRVQDFYRDAHQVIYAAIRDMYDKSKGIDVVTLAEELDQRGQLKDVGGDDTLEQIVTSVPHAANAKYYAELVKEKSVNRQLIENATEIIRDGYSNQFTADELARIGRAEDFQHRRGPDPGRDPRAQGSPQAGDGPDRAAARIPAGMR